MRPHAAPQAIRGVSRSEVKSEVPHGPRRIAIGPLARESSSGIISLSAGETARGLSYERSTFPGEFRDRPSSCGDRSATRGVGRRGGRESGRPDPVRGARTRGLPAGAERCKPGRAPARCDGGIARPARSAAAGRLAGRAGPADGPDPRRGPCHGGRLPDEVPRHQGAPHRARRRRPVRRPGGRLAGGAGAGRAGAAQPRPATPPALPGDRG